MCASVSQGPRSLGDCCAVSDSVGGRLSLLAPYEDTTAFLLAKGGGFEETVNLEAHC